MNIRDFFTTLKDSLWSQKFYAVMGSRTRKQGLRYFISLMFFLSFVITVMISIFLVPAANFGVNFISKLVSEKYPDEMIITFNNGTASTTPKKVFELPVSPDIWSSDAISKFSSIGITNMLVIDTSANFQNISQFNNAQTLALITKDFLVIKKDKTGFEVKPISSFPNITLTKGKAESFIYKFSSVLKYLLPLLIVIGFLALFCFSSIMNFLLVLIAAALIWALSNFANRQEGYREAFISALYAITLPALLDIALLIAGRPNGLHSLTTILLTALVWAFNVKIWVKPNLPSININQPPANK